LTIKYFSDAIDLKTPIVYAGQVWPDLINLPQKFILLYILIRIWGNIIC